MTKNLDQIIENGGLIEIIRDLMEELTQGATERYRLEGNSLRAIVIGNGKKVRAVVRYRGQLVFEVSQLAGTNIGYFLYMMREQAQDTLYAFFQEEGGLAA